MSSPRGLPLESVAKIANKLWDDVSVIDEYLNKRSEKMTKEQVLIIEGWKRAVHGKFIVERHLKSGSVFVSCDREDEVYIVCGIYSSWREMLDGFPMPQIVQTSLISFGNVIISDGIVQSDRMCLSKNMADEARQIYLKVKENGRLHKVM